ncbi:glucose oxidase [Metarhizium guizhouense ARSEF 977]|uniref:Glucose oxidase n=1 Tax=Metarhizium guizhouense (strain ARSEF 977) TaxID=1276136 RepID=A0A0B4GYS4_METGA|nr:glucose oxidase [Metarhizium guizhouense ARSEF 977]
MKLFISVHGSLLFIFLAVAGCVQSETFDFVIAGAGTAGLVIANRLSERSDLTVAVIEPGPDVRNDPNVQTVEFVFQSFNKSINWQYASVPQPTLNGRSFTYRAGKAIGGTSAVNGMVYTRGDKAQYDAWEDLGNDGWNWDSVFSAYKSGENFTAPTSAQAGKGAAYDKAAHGLSGPLTIGFPFVLSNSSFYDKARSTWQRLGLEPIPDLNSGDGHGFTVAPQTLDRDANVREDSSRAYYEAVEGRKNLKIIQGAVKRITWANSHGRRVVADGVEIVDSSGKLVKVGARKEVVLSASAYRNPLILEASGVGNPRILKKLGIETKVDLPGVGESMQDHHSLSLTYATAANIDGHTPFATMVTAHDVFGNKTSAMAAWSRAKLAQWAKMASKSCDGALSPKAIETRFNLQHDLIFKKNVTIAELFPTSARTTVVGQFWTTMPFSWGSVHLGSSTDINEPVIDPKLLSYDFDFNMLTAVGRLSQKAYSTAPLSDLITSNTSPGYDKLPLDATEAQWATYIKKNGRAS